MEKTLEEECMNQNIDNLEMKKKISDGGT